MDSFVNGVATSADSRGVVNGTAGGDRISGTGGSDHLAGGKGVDALYGGAGNDAFIFKLVDFDATLGTQPQDYVHDFGGAGGYVSSNNDFLAFTGFGAGSTLALNGAKTALAQSYHGGDPTLQFYTIHSTNSGLDYDLFVHSTNGHVLVRGDYNFYG